MICLSIEPLFSFVVPAYNVEKYISKTLKSLFSQTDKDFEIIVVDDGSTDNTYQVVEEILQNSDFQDYKILRKPNGGVSSARNVGIKHAKGKYIIFLDGDDYVSPKLVEKVKNVILKNDVDMVCWKFQSVDETDKPTNSQFPQEGLKEGKIYTSLQVLEKILIERNFFIWTASAAYSKELIVQNNLFYNEKYHFGEDQEFTYKYLASCCKVYFLDTLLSYYVQRPNSITKKADLKQFEIYFALMEARNYFSQKFDVQNDKLSKLLIALEERAILGFLWLMRKHTSALKWPSYNRLVKVINNKYPGLLGYALSRARSSRTTITKMKPLIRTGFEIFKFSLRLYIWISWVLYKIRIFKF